MPDVFDEEGLRLLDVYAHLTTQLVQSEQSAVHTLAAAFRTVNRLVRYKDPETGNHLERMSRFARLIARELVRSGKRVMDDEYIEYLFVFAPLHDVGKLGIPDRILLKPARLQEEEWKIMKTHASQGREIIDDVIANFGLEACHHLDLLRHVAEQHHETLDGQGYPRGLAGGEVSLEARISCRGGYFRRPDQHPSLQTRLDQRGCRRLAARRHPGPPGHGLRGALCSCLPEVEAIQRQLFDPEAPGV